jgi:hypothetical protein
VAACSASATLPNAMVLRLPSTSIPNTVLAGLGATSLSPLPANCPPRLDYSHIARAKLPLALAHVITWTRLIMASTCSCTASASRRTWALSSASIAADHCRGSLLQQDTGGTIRPVRLCACCSFGKVANGAVGDCATAPKDHAKPVSSRTAMNLRMATCPSA